ncbi:hypothetical protein Pint_31819 [Pistacia integerrima]|uniref:Uncharacterized protein n=1 Tax=Pistacia integerrima TaxID=434235 RepID=A0ACC0XP56_9ROSI|nr:hypothetical protein Pint_31819 [Pistacia integerrima]
MVKSIEFGSIKMTTLFNSQELWDLVEYKYVDVEEPNPAEETKKKDAITLFFIQQAVHETIFSRIAVANTSTEAWLILKKEFQGG